MSKTENVTQEKQALSLVVDRFDIAKKARRTFEDKWNRFYKLYRFQLNQGKQPYQANLSIPYCFANVETILPRMVANKPKVEFQAREPQDQINTEVLRNLIEYQWGEMNMDSKMSEWVKQVLIYGTSVLKVYWRLYKNGKLYDNPEADVVDLFDFFIDPSATSIDDAEYVIHRIVKPLNTIKDDPKYKNTNLIKGSAERINEFREQRDSVLGVNTAEDQHKQEIELLEYWEDNRVITVANKSIVIRDEENPFDHKMKPFVVIVNQLVPKEFYGIGEIEPLESLQNELNDLRNQRMDNVNLVLNRMWKARRDSTIQWDTLTSKPGGIILTDNMEDIIDITTPDITASSFREEESIKSDIQNTTGVTDYITGVSGKTSTATEIVKKTEESNQRFKMKIKNLENMGIKRLGEILLALNQQYIDREKIIRIVGTERQEYALVDPASINGSFDIIVIPGSTMPIDRESKKAQALELKKIFGADPLINQIELDKIVLDAYEIKSIDRLLQQPGTINEMNTPPGYHVMPDGSLMSNEDMGVARDGVQQEIDRQSMQEQGAPLMADGRQISKSATMQQRQYAGSARNKGV